MQRQESRVRDRRADGISEVVGFVIILAVVMAGLSLYLTYGVPVQGREEEITVMDNVRAWFVDYKTGVDQLWLNSPHSSDPTADLADGLMLFNSTIQQVNLSKVIDTGTVREKGFVGRFLPLFTPIPASAEVSIRSGDSLTLTAQHPGSDVIDTVRVDPIALVYASHNNYYLQQEYSYQLGGVFLRQWDPKGGAEADTVRLIAAPPLSIYHSPEPNTDQDRVELVLVNISAPASAIGSTSPIRVETWLNQDPAKPATLSGNNAYPEVHLVFNGTSEKVADAWEHVFRGAVRSKTDTDIAVNFDISRSLDRTEVLMTVTGPELDPAVRYDDVVLEVLDARYGMRLENVPTMIE